MNILIGGSHAARSKLKDEGLAILQVRAEFEDAMNNNGYLNNVPFDTVSFIFRFGGSDNWAPELGKINKRNELPVTIEFDAKELCTKSFNAVKSTLRLGTIEALCDVATNYDLPWQFLDQLRE